MASAEIFTVGGGDYIVNVLNAVAAWTGSGGYKGLLQVVLVMGLGYSLLVVAFSLDWRAWLNWFLQATLMYMALMVPRMDVHVTDRISPGLAPAHVANVPLGLALVASFTSQVGDYLVHSSELVFGLPGDLDYSRNGMIYGARLFEATRALRINDPEFAANLDEHVRQCVFYDVLLGRNSMKTLAAAPDLWMAIGPGSPARAQRLLQRAPDGQVTATIETCRDAYTRLSQQWGRMVDDLGKLFGRRLYPRRTEALARAKLFADLPLAYRYLTGVSASASDILKQTLTINAFAAAMHGAAGASGSNGVDVYAQTRADLQTERTYSSIAHAAMTWVPVLNIVLTVLFYALFPVLFPLFLMPRSGPSALKGYLTGFFYLAAWGPLYVILHMIVMLKGAGEVAGAGGGQGITLASFTGVAQASGDIALLAGYLVASIPFLAGGVARGAMAISHQATSFLNPSQNAAEEAAREASTGNVALGNSSFDNQTIQTRQHEQWNQAPGFTFGAAHTRSVNETGTATTSFAGNQTLDVPVSRLPFAPQVMQSVQAEAVKVASQTRARGDVLSNQASQSSTEAVSRFNEFRHAVTTDSSVANSYGTEDRANIVSSFSEVDQASRMLQDKFGLRAEVANTIAAETFVNASGGAEGRVGVSLGRLGSVGIRAGASGGVAKRWTDQDVAAVSRDAGRIEQALQNWASSRSWSESQDAFERSVATTSRSDVASKAAGISETVTQARTLSSEARRYYEASQRLEQRWSVQDGQGVAGALNTSDAFVAFARDEIARTPLVYQAFDPANAAHWHSSDPAVAGERDLLVQRYVVQAGAAIRSEMEAHLLSPGSLELERPDASPIGSPTDGRREDASRSDRSTVALRANAAELRAEVARRGTQGRASIDRHRGELAPAQGLPVGPSLDRARELSQSSDRDD